MYDSQGFVIMYMYTKKLIMGKSLGFTFQSVKTWQNQNWNAGITQEERQRELKHISQNPALKVKLELLGDN